MNTSIIGWDIGGAHLKAARLTIADQSLQVQQVSCPLWQGIDKLDQAFVDIMSQFPVGDHYHAVTMTGELVDCFETRQQGVFAIIASLLRHFPSDRCWIYAGTAGFLEPRAVGENDIMLIASANWLASASWAASRQPQALFVDMGSTTTDLLLIQNHRLQNIGYTDYERLISGELVYTGVVRTAVMAVAQDAVFNGQSMGLMTEYFATMADVYRLTGDLNDLHDQGPTADGAEKTPIASARRLSRMTGYDFNANDWSLWLDFAGYLKQLQKKRLSAACQRQLLRCSGSGDLVLIGAGVGRFLLKELAVELGLQYVDFNDLLPGSGPGATLDSGDCAPAAALANLAQRLL